MAKIVIMQGLPASGKSTRAKEIVAEGASYRINRDLLRTMLHFDKWTGQNEEVTRDAARAIADALLGRGRSVVIDDTNLNPGVVQMWVDLAKKHNAKIQYEKMETSFIDCVIRDAKREKKVGKSVILGMAMQYGLFPDTKTPIVVCDLDGTLCNIEHRLHYAKGLLKDWDKFFAGVPDDLIREEVVTILRKYHQEGKRIIFVSARPERCREDTEEWLAKHLPEDIGYMGLFMRKNHDKRDDVEVKQQVFDTYFKGKYPIEVVIDDRPKVIRMWRSNGLNVIDVGSGVEF